MANGEIQDYATAPRLTGDDRAREIGAQGGDESAQVLRDGGEVVAAVRFVRVAVATEIDRHGGPSGGGEPPRHSVPEPRIGGEAVNQQEGRLPRRGGAGGARTGAVSGAIATALDRHPAENA